MPQSSSELAALVSDLHARLARVVEAAHEEGRAQALGEIRSLVGGGAPAAPVHRGPGRPRGSKNAPKAGKSDGRRNSWAGMTPAARLARINSIRKGKGLPPRSE